MMKSSLQRRRIASNLLLSEGRFIANPLVEVDEQGYICSVRQLAAQERDSSPHTEFYNGIMVAGLINAHSHLELAYLRGEIPEGGGFTTFASQIGALRNSFTPEQRQRAIEVADSQMYREGVAAVGDIINGDSTLALKNRSQIEYHNFAELFGLNTNSTESLEELLRHPNTSLTPHSTYSLNDKIFREIATRGDYPLSIHFMESAEESELYNNSGALHRWYLSAGFKCDFLHYKSPAQRIVESIPASRSVMLVHNCYVTQQDIDIIMSHFTAPVYWVLCPRSNRYISGVMPPVELLRRNNLNICIGTDSLASNHTLSILDELRLLHEIPLAERLDWATRQGAAALRLNHLGEIKEGRQAVINILSGINYSTMELTPQSAIRRV